MAQKRKAKRSGGSKRAKTSIRSAKRQAAPDVVEAEEPSTPPTEPPDIPNLGIPDVETSQQAIAAIAQDAVLILRRGLAYRAVLAIESPGSVSMGDCIALLRLTTELGAAARRGSEEIGQKANYDRLLPAERVQLAALLLKVDYVDAEAG